MLDERRTDPIGFWLRRATERASFLRMHQGDLLEAAIVSGALSREWLEREARRRIPRKAAIFDLHPIVEAFTVDGDDHLALVVELASYLRDLHSCVGFDDILSSLRDTQGFDSALLQLAYGWRIKMRGGEVSFEPKAKDGRRGDIAALWKGERAMFECFVPHRRQDLRRAMDGFKDFTAYSLTKFGDAARDLRKRVRVSIWFESVLRDADRAEIERVTIRAIKDVIAGGRLSCGTPCARIEVEDLPPGSPERDFRDDGVPNFQACHLRDMTGIMANFEAPASLAQKPLEGVDVMSHQRGTRIVWWVPSDLAKELMHVDVQRTAEAIEKKFAQTRPDSGDAARIVVVSLGWVDTRLAEAMTWAEQLGENVFRRQRSVNGLVLVGRQFHAERHRYTTFWLPAHSCPDFVEDLVRSCAELDCHDNDPEPGGAPPATLA